MKFKLFLLGLLPILCFASSWSVPHTLYEYLTGSVGVLFAMFGYIGIIFSITKRRLIKLAFSIFGLILVLHFVPKIFFTLMNTGLVNTLNVMLQYFDVHILDIMGALGIYTIFYISTKYYNRYFTYNGTLEQLRLEKSLADGIYKTQDNRYCHIINKQINDQFKIISDNNLPEWKNKHLVHYKLINAYFKGYTKTIN